MAGVDLEVVARIVSEVAAEEIMPRWRNLASGDISRKTGSGTLVTIADHAAEVALERRLKDLLPGSLVIGEEAVATDPGVLQHFRSSDPVWIIDPIDGTRRFTEGQTAFDVLVALVIGGRGVAGWIYAPAEGDLYLGELGGGAFHRVPEGTSRRLSARHGRSLAELEGIVTSQGFLNRKLPDPALERERFRGYVRHVCAGHNYARLLRGESDFLINFSTLPWDHMPGLVLVGEAGFHHARLDGAPFDPMDPNGGLLIAPDAGNWAAIKAALLPSSRDVIR